MRTIRAAEAATNDLARTFERLASGQRINRAADDAAGLSVTATLDADARIYSQGVRNVQDAVSALSIAEGALMQLQSIVTRQIELAEQSANGVYSYAQRKALHDESAALTKEYNRILASTTFNGTKLFEDGLANIRIQHGTGVDQSTLVGAGTSLGTVAGDFNFTFSNGLSGGAGRRDELIVDFNNDGKADIVSAAIDGGGALYLDRGDGSGGTTSAGSIFIGGNVYLVRAGDINYDGNIDLVAASNNEIYAFLGNGNGTFRAIQTYASGTAVGGLAVADFNGDGYADVATSEQNVLAIRYGNASGTFGGRVTYAAAGNNTEMEQADFNGDGRIDLFVGGSTSRVFLNGPAGFTSTAITMPGIADTALGDFNGDGFADIAGTDVATTGYVLLGNGDGTFRAAMSSTLGVSQIRGLHAGDFDNDGRDDLVVLNHTGPQTLVLQRSLGDGTFSEARSFAIGGFPTEVTVGDLNGDGRTDIVYTNEFGGNKLLNQASASGRRQFAVEEENLLSKTTARFAIDTFKNRQSQIALEQGSIGVQQSRLATVISNLESGRLNFEGASSRIKDADIAAETSTLVRAQIVQQAASAVLAQANQEPALALRLLQDT